MNIHGMIILGNGLNYFFYLTILLYICITKLLITKKHTDMVSFEKLIEIKTYVINNIDIIVGFVASMTM